MLLTNNNPYHRKKGGLGGRAEQKEPNRNQKSNQSTNETNLAKLPINYKVPKQGETARITIF